MGGVVGAERRSEGQEEGQAPSMPYVQQAHPRPRGVERRTRRPEALLETPPCGHAGHRLEEELEVSRSPDLGDLVIVLLASTLAGLRDRLAHDGFDDAADLVADLVEVTDDYLTSVPCPD